MKRTTQAVGVAVTGLAVAVAGFLYDVMFAGIPYQDPTPELQSNYEFHSSVAVWFYRIGGVMLLLGIIAIPVMIALGRGKQDASAS